jgi:hypothetical protein
MVTKLMEFSKSSGSGASTQLFFRSRSKSWWSSFVDRMRLINASDRTNMETQFLTTMGFNVQMNYKTLILQLHICFCRNMVRNYERNLTDVNRLNYVLDRWTGGRSTNSTLGYNKCYRKLLSLICWRCFLFTHPKHAIRLCT